MPQATRTHTPIRAVTAPAAIPQAATPRRFIVEIAYPHGNYLSEVDTARCDLNATIKDLVDGQYDRIVRVFELRDASREIADAVADFSYLHNVPLTKETADFVAFNGVHVPRIHDGERDPDEAYDRWRDDRIDFGEAVE